MTSDGPHTLNLYVELPVTCELLGAALDAVSTVDPDATVVDDDGALTIRMRLSRDEGTPR